MTTLLEVLKTPAELLALEPEELGAILLEFAPSMTQNRDYGFTFSDITSRLYQGGAFTHGNNAAFGHDSRHPVSVAIAEAISWLESQSLLVRNPEQNGSWYLLTRRAAKLETRADLRAYQVARTLPADLLPPEIESRVRSLFARGDYDTAIFQAFKVVEIVVRAAANCPAEMTASKVMRLAFHPAPECGPLTNPELPPSEQQAMSDLFVGAMGHARNPPGHRDIDFNVKDAARLVLFAGYLLDLVQLRIDASP